MKEEFYKLLDKTTFELRNGEAVVKTVDDVIEVFAMPHVDELVNKEDFEIVDLVLLSVAVNKMNADKSKDQLIEFLKDYPDQHRFSLGLSYIEVGAMIGSQDRAFQLFALGKYLKLWEVITPITVGAKGYDAKNAARNGFIMISGYKP